MHQRNNKQAAGFLLLFFFAATLGCAYAEELPWITVEQGPNRYFLADQEGREVPLPLSLQRAPYSRCWICGQVILRGSNVEFLQRELDEDRRPIGPSLSPPRPKKSFSRLRPTVPS